jgi:hypothetical protein
LYNFEAALSVYILFVAGVNVPVEDEMTFSCSMSEDDFFEWLKSKGVNERDHKTLVGKMDRLIRWNPGL